MEIVGEKRRSERGRAAAALGVASALLLVGSIRWAHHWGVRTDALVASWGIATIAALVSSIRALRAETPRRRAAKTGLALALLSVVVLVFAGLAYAAGSDPAGACGGG